MDDNQKLELIKEFNAPVITVWNYWITPEKFGQWYGWPGTSQDVAMDIRPEGTWRSITVMPTGERYPQGGVYKIIEAPKHLRFHFIDLERPDNPDYETMDIVLESIDDGARTRMAFVQFGNLPVEEYEIGLRQGWSGFFDKLSELVNKG